MNDLPLNHLRYLLCIWFFQQNVWHRTLVQTCGVYCTTHCHCDENDTSLGMINLWPESRVKTCITTQTIQLIKLSNCLLLTILLVYLLASIHYLCQFNQVKCMYLTMLSCQGRQHHCFNLIKYNSHFPWSHHKNSTSLNIPDTGKSMLVDL